MTKSKNHFLDGGANVGQTFDDFLTKTERFDGWTIWLIEPSPRHLPALLAKARAMCERYNVIVCPFGLRGESGLAPFYEKTDPLGDSFMPDVLGNHEQSNVATGILLLALGMGILDFIGGIPPAEEIVLKLDVEGAEYEILPMLLYHPTLERVNELHVEFHRLKTLVPMNKAQLEAAYAAKGKPLRQWLY